MKTHLAIKGKEIPLDETIFIKLRECTPVGNWTDIEEKFRKVQLESKPFSVENPPEISEIFWHITASVSGCLHVRDFVYADDDFDNECLAQNNCFRTAELAKTALIKVLEALKQ